MTGSSVSQGGTELDHLTAFDAGPDEYHRERAAQGLVPYDRRGARTSWNEAQR